MLFGAAALVSAAENVSPQAETAGDLLNFLEGVENISAPEARKMLETMPIPEKSSMVFRNSVKSLTSKKFKLKISKSKIPSINLHLSMFPMSR